MKHGFSIAAALKSIAITLALAAGLCGCAATPAFGGDTWKEEVLLHDGQKIIVERNTQRGGRHEVGQKGDYIAQSLNFTPPGTSRTIEWQDNRSEDLGNSSFLPMVLDIAKGTPYLVASPMGCLSYNKWGRPNPPYVVFKYDAKAWQRIPLEELPMEIKTPNLIQSSPDLVAAQQDRRFVSAQKIAEIVAGTDRPEYRSILREPVGSAGRGCGEMVYDGNGGWIGVGWFKKQPSLEACLNYCGQEKMATQHCPCNSIFKDKK